jgi:hypothetical protein
LKKFASHDNLPWGGHDEEIGNDCLKANHTALLQCSIYQADGTPRLLTSHALSLILNEERIRRVQMLISAGI